MENIHEPGFFFRFLLKKEIFFFVLSLQLFLIENESNWMELNFNLIYQIGFENSSFLELCTDYVFGEDAGLWINKNETYVLLICKHQLTLK